MRGVFWQSLTDFLLSLHICTGKAVLLREIKKYRHFLMKRRYLSCPLASIFQAVISACVCPLILYCPAYHGVSLCGSVCPVPLPFSVSVRPVYVASSKPFCRVNGSGCVVGFIFSLCSPMNHAQSALNFHWLLGLPPHGQRSGYNDL